MDKYKKNLYLYLSISKPNIAGNKSIKEILIIDKYFPGGSDGNKICLQCWRPRLGKSPGRRHGNSLQYSCLENSHGQRSPQGCKESDTAEWLSAQQRPELSVNSNKHLLLDQVSASWWGFGWSRLGSAVFGQCLPALCLSLDQLDPGGKQCTPQLHWMGIF